MTENIKASKLEADFLGDLKMDFHELWELYGFIRLHYPSYSDDEVTRHGRSLIEKWIRNNWLHASRSKTDDSPIAGDEVLATVDTLGRSALDPRKGILWLKPTDEMKRALK